MKSFKFLAVAFGLTAASALFAGSIDYSAAINGLVAPAGTTFSATGGALVVDTKNSLTFLGVTGGGAGTEISPFQSVEVTFDKPAIFKSLTLGLLFNGPEYGDNNEIAASLTNGSDLFELRLVGEDAAKWYLNGAYLFDVPGVGTQNGGFGLFKINNPFGGIGVNTLSLYPYPYGAGNVDFGLVAFSTVPDAGTTVALLGTALLGLAAMARRRRA